MGTTATELDEGTALLSYISCKSVRDRSLYERCRREAWGKPWPPLYACVAGPQWLSRSPIDLPAPLTADGQRQRRPVASQLSEGEGAIHSSHYRAFPKTGFSPEYQHCSPLGP
jgi:hypothetical protein